MIYKTGLSNLCTKSLQLVYYVTVVDGGVRLRHIILFR